MTFKEWKAWYSDLPWTVKWFVVLVLLRPIIDNFYWVKQINPAFSPLNIVGVLTPVLIVASLSSRTIPRRRISGIDMMFIVYGLFVAVNSIIMDISFPKIDVIGNSIKFITPPFLFIYLRRAIRSGRDLNGVLTTFLYSCIYIIFMLAYENLFHPLQEAHVTEGRGGGSRFIGEYNDMMNYAIYIVGGLLISGYYFLKNIYRKPQTKYYTMKFYVILGLVFIGLISIKHVSTWAVCLSLFFLIVVFNFKNLKGFVIVFFLVALVVAFFADTIYKEQIEPLINKEMSVVEGDAETSGALNGRVGRWERYFDIWFDEMSVIDRAFGVAGSGHRASPVMVGAGMHSDYVRNLFLVGIVGLFIYIFFLFQVAIRLVKFRIPEKFLILGALSAILLHSISTLPLMYSSYLYLLFSIFSYACLPLKDAYSSITWKRDRRVLKGRMVIPPPAETVRHTG